MLTLRELRSMVSETYEGRVISKKRLQESNEKIVVKEKIDADTEISVYENGSGLNMHLRV